MKLRIFTLSAAGLLLLALAGGLVGWPRPAPRPTLPELPPFQASDRIALVVPGPGSFPVPEALGVVQRARAAGAEVRIVEPGRFGDYAPTLILQPAPWPNTPTGYHPDLWPSLPADEINSGQDWHLCILTPEEMSVRNAAVLTAAHALRDSGTDDSSGTREAALLSRARRAELVLPLNP